MSLSAPDQGDLREEEVKSPWPSPLLCGLALQNLTERESLGVGLAERVFKSPPGHFDAWEV